MKTLSGSKMSFVPSPPQPLEIRARTLVLTTAWKTNFVKLSGSSTTMEPNPMYTSGGPVFRKATRSSGGL